jgi:hypothetical protein
MKLDAAQTTYFSRELEQIETRLFEAKYPDLEAEALLPNRIQVADGMKTYTWRNYDKRALAVPMGGSEDGAPLSDISTGEDTTKLMSWKAAYGWSIEEIKAAQMTGLPLEAQRAMAARRALAESLNTVALQGYASLGIKGMFNMDNTIVSTVPNGASASPLWINKTADEILLDLFAAVDAVGNGSLEIESVNTLVMPYSSLKLLSSKRLSASASDTTILAFFQAQRPGINIRGARYLDTAGAGGTKRMVAFDSAQVFWLVSVPLEVLAPEIQGFRTVVNMRARGGGAISPYPKSMHYVDGI